MIIMTRPRECIRLMIFRSYNVSGSKSLSFIAIIFFIPLGLSFSTLASDLTKPSPRNAKTLYGFLSGVGRLTLNSEDNDSKDALSLLGRRLRHLTDYLEGKTNDPDKEPLDFCSGFLVHPKIVITAAHCIEAIPNFCPNIDFRLEANTSFGATHTTFFQTGCKQIIALDKNLDIGVFELKEPADTSLYQALPYIFNVEHSLREEVYVLSAFKDFGSRLFGYPPGILIPCQISSSKRSDIITTTNPNPEIGYYMQCHGSIRHGMSGSPVLNNESKVIGVLIGGTFSGIQLFWQSAPTFFESSETGIFSPLE